MLNDPNDFAQFLIMCIPLLTLAWRKGRVLRNMMFVTVPAIILLCGVGLTHSRGGFIALSVILLLSLRNRLGIVRSAIAAGVVFAAILALNMTGGRDVSVAAGHGRVTAWGAGIGFLKTSPLFGIGFNNFLDQWGIVAHNSYIQCAAELGLFGYFFWMGLLVFTVSQLNRSTASARRHNGSAASVQPDHREGECALDLSAASQLQIKREEERISLRRWSKIVQISLWGFLAAAYFLTRCYTLEFFLLVAIVGVVAELGREAWPPERQFSIARLMLLTFGWEIGSILWIYVSGKIMLG
jgi:O-antigen ligase